MQLYSHMFIVQVETKYTKFVFNNLFKFRYRLSLTSDGWSSISKDSYMSLTAHYIDKDWNLITRCLRTAYHPEAHTAVNLAHFFRESLNQYGLKTGYVVTMTTDRAANMIAATREAGKIYFLSEQLTNAMFIYSSAILSKM